jgi:hypothetical protein
MKDGCLRIYLRVVLPSILNVLGIITNELRLCQWSDNESETLLRW